MGMNRRTMLAATAASLPIFSSQSWAETCLSESALLAPPSIRLGLVTYNWGKQWDVPTLISNCDAAGFEGVELRSTHRHGVEIDLPKMKRKEVKKRFADSQVELVGLGSACEYHSPDQAVVRKNIEETKAFIRLCHDVGGKGVKVRPNGLPKDVPLEKTLEQIGRSLRTVADFAADYDIKIRLEVHGRGSAELPLIKRMIDVANHKHAVVCWNCNPTDLNGKGLKSNFDLVQDKIEIVHIHDLLNSKYPWAEFFELLKASRFQGWTLLEEGKVPKDIVGAMKRNRIAWEKFTLPNQS